MDFQPLKYIYKPAQNSGAYTLVLLHGTGSDETGLIPLAESFGGNYNILGLRGNVLENGMPRFFKRLGAGIFDEADLHLRTDEMVHFVRQLSEKKGFDLSKLIAVGYSNGANIAGATLVKYPRFFAGAVLFRPMQPFIAIPDMDGNGIPVFYNPGKFDPTVSPEQNVQYKQILKQSGFDVTLQEADAGHGLTNQDVESARQWLGNNFTNEE